MRLFNVSFRRTKNGFSLFIPSRTDHNPQSAKSEYFEIHKQNPVKLNVGGAKGHPKVDGWTVVDIRSSADVVLDISKQKLPFDDNSVDVIFCSHTLEHIIPQRLDFVLSEFYRVLDKRSSLLRVSVPDIRKAITAYVENDIAFFDTSKVSPIDPDAPLGGKLAGWFYSTRLVRETGEASEMKGHVHCFDFEYIRYCLNRSGFTNVWESSYRISALPELRGIAFDRYPSESIFIESILKNRMSDS